MNQWSTASVGICSFGFLLWILPPQMDLKAQTQTLSNWRHKARLLIVSIWGWCILVYSEFMQTFTQLDSLWVTNPCKRELKKLLFFFFFSRLIFQICHQIKENFFYTQISMAILCLRLWNPSTDMCVLMVLRETCSLQFWSQYWKSSVGPVAAVTRRELERMLPPFFYPLWIVTNSRDNMEINWL